MQGEWLQGLLNSSQAATACGSWQGSWRRMRASWLCCSCGASLPGRPEAQSPAATHKVSCITCVPPAACQQGFWQVVAILHEELKHRRFRNYQSSHCVGFFMCISLWICPPLLRNHCVSSRMEADVETLAFVQTVQMQSSGFC